MICHQIGISPARSIEGVDQSPTQVIKLLWQLIYPEPTGCLDLTGCPQSSLAQEQGKTNNGTFYDFRVIL